MVDHPRLPHHPVLVRFPPALAADIDRRRGTQSRHQWILDACTWRLDSNTQPAYRDGTGPSGADRRPVVTTLIGSFDPDEDR